MIASGPQPGAAFGPELAWTPVEVFTGEQRLSCEMRLRGRLRERLLDTEPGIRIRNASTIACDPSMPRLNGIAEGLLHRQHVITCTLVSGEPHDPDAPPMVGRHALFEGKGWGGRFVLVHDVTTYANWGGAPLSWNLPEAYVNLELALGIYLS